MDRTFTNLRQYILHTSVHWADEHVLVHPPGQLVSGCIAKDNDDSQRLFFWHVVFVKISSS